MSFQNIFSGNSFRYAFSMAIVLGLSIQVCAQAPANDDPCNAIALTASTACNYQTFSNDNATASAGVPAPGCADYQGGDVWFSVVVPAGGALSFDTQSGTITDGGMAIYSGTCNNLTLIDCDDDGGTGLMPFIQAAGLTPGSTIWIRIWDYSGDDFGSFGICVTIPPPPPANDEPCNAISLTVQASCNYQTFTNESALPSAGVPDPGCANYQGGDVWFSVVVPAGGALLFDTQTGTMTDGGMAIYSGTCSNLTLLLCDDNGSSNGNMPQIISNSLTPGSTIWVRVWSYGNADNGTFGICVTIPPPPPINDEPCNAITLIPQDTCSYSTYTNAFATASQGVPAPGCANYLGGDVWFKVVVPCGGSMTFDMIEGQVTDGGMAIYSGTCNNLTLIECDDDDSPNGLMSFISLNNLNQNDTLWIRVWEYGNDNNGTFGICVTIPPPPGPGSSCQTANSFCTGTTYVFPNNTNVPSLGGGGIYGCLLTTPNPVWYYMQIQNPGDISITINQISNTGNPIDVDFALWGPFPTLASTCGGISASNIVDCSYSTAATEVADITNAQSGQFYMLLITNYANQAGVITFQQTGGTASTNCAVICNIGASSTAPVCLGSTFSLSATSLPGGTYSWVGPNCFRSTQQNPMGVTPPQSPGNYNYIVTGISNTGSTCYASTIVTVLPGIDVGNDTSILICNSSSLNLYNVYDTTGLQSYSWTSGGVPVANPSSVNTAGMYQFAASGGQGCKDTAVLDLTLGQVSASLSTSNADCNGDGQIVLSNPVGNAPFSYTISSNPGSPQSTGTFTVPQGSYTMTVTDASQCTYSVPATVGYTDNLTLTMPDDTAVCSGGSVTLTTTSNAGSYSWAPVAGLNNPSIASPVATPVAPTTYVLTATLGSCSKTDSVRVDFQTGQVTATIAATDANCSGAGQIVVSNPTGTAPFTYTISTNPGAPQSNGTFAAPQGNYTMTVKDANQCSFSGPATVGFNNNLSLSTLDDTSVCAGRSVTLTTTSNGTSFSWSPATGLNNPAVASPVATPNSNTTYTVTATLGSCTKSATVAVAISQSASVDAGPTQSIFSGGNATLQATATGASTITWSPASGLNNASILNPIASPSATTLYTITVSNTDGCVASDTVSVIVVPYCVLVKNAFSPNGDGLNDKWTVYGDYSCLKNVTVQVYNRYGNKVFESRDYRNDWDGTYKGKPVPDGTYYAVVAFTLVTGKTSTVKSDLTIIR